jgi:hypothetical protein
MIDGRHVVELRALTVDIHLWCGELTDQCKCGHWFGDWPSWCLLEEKDKMKTTFEIFVHAEDNLWHLALNTYPKQADIRCTGQRVNTQRIHCVSSEVGDVSRAFDLDGGSLCARCLLKDTVLGAGAATGGDRT